MRAEDGGQKTDVRGRKTELRCRVSGVREQSRA
jgi:hypothetical protein